MPEFSAVETGDLRYVIGRKGTGKTAVIERLRQRSEQDPLSFYVDLSLRSFPLTEFRELRDKSYRDKSQFVSAWSFLILIELSKLILADEGCKTSEELEDLKNFLELNNLQNLTGFATTITFLTNNALKVKVGPRWLGGEYSSGSQEQQPINVHYQRIVTELTKKICAVSSDSEYWLFVDELDEGYRAGDEHLRLVLLALLRAVEDTAQAFKLAGVKYRPLLVLRSDIFDRLEDNDLNKLDDFVLRLNWTSREESDEYSLKLIPEARIKKSIPGVSKDAWESVVENYSSHLPNAVNTLWAYMANRTYDRPRDIVKFLKCCTKHAPSGLLTFEHVKMAEDKYSDWLYREIRDEIHSYLACWKEAMSCITRIGKARFTAEAFIDVLSKDHSVSKWVTDNGKTYQLVVETLFDFSVVGNYAGERWLFKYKDHDLGWDPDMDLIVHYGLYKKLRIK